MKKIMGFTFIIIFLFSINLKADNGCVSLQCQNTSYKYFMCNPTTHEKSYRCTKNPYNVVDNGVTLLPMKWGGCVTLDQSTFRVDSDSVRQSVHVSSDTTVSIFHNQVICLGYNC